MTQQTNPVPLKPCPGCGSACTRIIGGPGTAAGPHYWAGCDHCRWRAIGSTADEAAALWNTRTLEAQNAALTARIAELEGVLQTNRDYVADAANGHLFYADSGEGFIAMAKEDLARIDAALAKATQS